MRNVRSTDLAPQVGTTQLAPVSHPSEQDEITGKTGHFRRRINNTYIYINTNIYIKTLKKHDSTCF